MNQAWKTLFQKLLIKQRLDEVGEFRLSAQQIKSITGKEPRNMTKWDSREARPEVLKDARITILPVNRKGYILLKGDGYLDLPAAKPATHYSPKGLEKFTTLQWPKELTTESSVIDIALIASMFKTFTGESELTLTIRGRSGTKEFCFNFKGEVQNHKISVDRAQIEIDAGFEGDRVWLVEAKRGEPDDFHIRQLFYPWRLWKTLTRKEVIPVFLTYSNRRFGFAEYRFTDENNYHSITPVENRQHWYTFDKAPEHVPTLDQLFNDSQQTIPPTRVFPQADTLAILIATVEYYEQEASMATEVSELLGFDPRQGAYYTSGAEWLNLVGRRRGRIALTQRGAVFASARGIERFKILFRAIAATPIFCEAIKARLAGDELTEAEIADRIRTAGYARGTTPARRAKTVVKWLDWLWREHDKLCHEAQGG